MKIEFSWREFRKILRYKISWKSVQWESSCSMRTDRHYEAKCRFSQFSERDEQELTQPAASQGLPASRAMRETSSWRWPCIIIHFSRESSTETVISIIQCGHSVARRSLPSPPCPGTCEGLPLYQTPLQDAWASRFLVLEGGGTRGLGLRRAFGIGRVSVCKAPARRCERGGILTSSSGFSSECAGAV
jgi:hypothetical protein